MKISIIIVNYKVPYFICQCVASVKKALKQIDNQGEIIVIDNHSQDNSLSYINEKHPDIQIIENKENLGFSKANNIGIKKSKGEYILLLNPDIIIQEDTLKKCLEHISSLSKVGGMGIKMINSTGKFLAESKRGIPSIWATFCKISGLSTIFPHSPLFSNYHLGHLDYNKDSKIEVISGAFIMIKSEILDKVEPLDESFFMYGEDIDFSYRILLAGFENHYFSKSCILHYKGESSKKNSVKYISSFHKAMILFYKKHYAKKLILFTPFIYLSVYLRAIYSIFHNLFSSALKRLNKVFKFIFNVNPKVVIIGDLHFFESIKSTLSLIPNNIIKIKHNDTINQEDEHLFDGRLYQLKDFVDMYKCKQVYFSSDLVEYSVFIKHLLTLKGNNIKSFISYDNYLIGSNVVIKMH